MSNLLSSSEIFGWSRCSVQCEHWKSLFLHSYSCTTVEKFLQCQSMKVTTKDTNPRSNGKMRIKTTQATIDPIPHLHAFSEYFLTISRVSGQFSFLSLFLVSRALTEYLRDIIPRQERPHMMLQMASLRWSVSSQMSWQVILCESALVSGRSSKASSIFTSFSSFAHI